MPLQLASSHIHWRTDCSRITPAPADEGTEKVKAFVEAFFGSHGLSGHTDDDHACRWQSAGEQSFHRLFSSLLAKVRPHVTLSEIDLVIVAHWTPDVDVGSSVTNAMICEMGAEKAFGIAINEHGLTAAFVALQIIASYLQSPDRHPAAPKRALLLVADQNATLYPVPALTHEHPAASACLMVVEAPADGQGCPDSLTFRGYRKIQLSSSLHATAAMLSVLTMFSQAESRQQIVILTSTDFARQLHEDGQFRDQRIECWDETLLSAAPWILLKQRAQLHSHFVLVRPEQGALIVVGFAAGT